mgnify:CR=1 FL=1
MADNMKKIMDILMLKKTMDIHTVMNLVKKNMKKISNRNAMSASEDDGISLAALDLRFSPP